MLGCVSTRNKAMKINELFQHKINHCVNTYLKNLKISVETDKIYEKEKNTKQICKYSKEKRIFDETRESFLEKRKKRMKMIHRM
jgi:hypothetical protein